MADDHTRYLHEQLTTAQSKYAYFLLAAAASAIALALNRTASEPLEFVQLPLGAAVVCWGLSFYFGCRYLAWVDATLQANTAISMAQSGTLPGIPDHPLARQAAAEGAREAAEQNSEHAGRNARRQFRFLVAGAVFYVVWHVLAMAERTPGITLNLFQ